MATSPDSAQLMAMFLKIINAKKTIEIGVFTGYSLLLTALTIPDDGRVSTVIYPSFLLFESMELFCLRLKIFIGADHSN